MIEYVMNNNNIYFFSKCIYSGFVMFVAFLIRFFTASYLRNLLPQDILLDITFFLLEPIFVHRVAYSIHPLFFSPVHSNMFCRCPPNSDCVITKSNYYLNVSATIIGGLSIHQFQPFNFVEETLCKCEQNIENFNNFSS